MSTQTCSGKSMNLDSLTVGLSSKLNCRFRDLCLHVLTIGIFQITFLELMDVRSKLIFKILTIY